MKRDDPRKRLADGDGLVLHLFAKSGMHSWRLDYRFQGKRNTLTLGAFPDTSLALARRDSLGRAYNRTEFVEQRREMLQTWADCLDQLRSGQDSVPRKGMRLPAR